MTNFDALKLQVGDVVKIMRNPIFPNTAAVVSVTHCPAAAAHLGIPAVIVMTNMGSYLPSDLERG